MREIESLAALSALSASMSVIGGMRLGTEQKPCPKPAPDKKTKKRREKNKQAKASRKRNRK